MRIDLWAYLLTTAYYYDGKEIVLHMVTASSLTFIRRHSLAEIPRSKRSNNNKPNADEWRTMAMGPAAGPLAGRAGGGAESGESRADGE